MIITWRLGSRFILIVLVIVFLISLGLAEWASTHSRPKIASGSFFLLPTRGWELLVGVFIAFFLKNRAHPQSININQIMSFLGLSMVIFSIFLFDENTPFPSLITLVPPLVQVF